MENIVLYRSVDELRQKVQLLRNGSSLAEGIAANGQRLVEREYSFARVGQRIAEALKAPLRARPSLPWRQRLYALLGG